MSLPEGNVAVGPEWGFYGGMNEKSLEIPMEHGGMNGNMLVNGDDTVDGCKNWRQLVTLEGNLIVKHCRQSD